MNLKKIAQRLYLTEVIAKSSYFTQESGIIDNNIDLKILHSHLREILALEGKLDLAKQRWIIQEGIKVNEGQWSHDKRALMSLAGFFSHRQSFISLKLTTLTKRLHDSPYALFYDSIGPKWLAQLIATCKALLKGLDKWEKESSQVGEDSGIQQEFSFDGYTIKNTAGLSDSKMKPYLDIIREGTSKLTSGLAYGTIRITTSKESRGNKTVAYYTPHNDELALMIDMKDSHPLHSFIHEMGHRYWYTKCDNQMKKEITDFYNSARKGSISAFSKDSYFYVLKDIISGNYADIHKEFIDKHPEADIQFKEWHDKANKFINNCVDEIIKLGIENEVPLENREILYKSLHGILVYLKMSFGSYGMGKLFEKMGNPFKKLIDKWLNELAKVVVSERDLTNFFASFHLGDKNIFPTTYSKSDVEEFFAENYSFYRGGGSPISDTMTNILSLIG